MNPPIPTELVLVDDAASTTAIEAACRYATSSLEHDTVAVAVDVAHAKQAADLLFGTGVGALSVLDPGQPLRDQARRSVAAGATEVALPLVGLPAIADLRLYLGSQVPLTIDVTSASGLDLSAAEQALRIGADFVSLRPDFSTPQGLADSALLLGLASQLRLGGVKLGAPHAADRQVHDIIDAHEWAKAGRARVCLEAEHLIDPS